MACSQPSGFVSDATDCDDAATTTNPGAAEVCDSADNDCDGTVDEADATDAATWYADADGDPYGDPSTATRSCSQPSGYLADDADCDDTDASLNPDTVWYIDGDGDGFGDAATTTTQCLQPSGYLADDTDCDDTDAAVYPGATETWYDGTDADCAGDDDYDQDGDGESPYAYGGTDCDDTDAAASDAAGTCRASCTPPSTTTLAANDPSGVSDLQFDADCDAWVSTLISGTDYVYTIDSSGGTTRYTGASNHNMGSLALDPSSTTFAVSYNNVGYLGVSSGSSIPVVATGGFDSGTNFSSGYLRQSASSIAWDSSGCIWVPNFASTGSIDCFSSTGSGTTLATLSGYVESVALDPDEALYVSVGSTVFAVDSSGSTSTYYALTDTVLDMVFDITGELYVLTDANDIIVVDAGGAGEAVFATVGSEGKLAISPDGTLYHLDSQPVGAASYSSWSL